MATDLDPRPGECAFCYDPLPAETVTLHWGNRELVVCARHIPPPPRLPAEFPKTPCNECGTPSETLYFGGTCFRCLPEGVRILIAGDPAVTALRRL